MFVQPTAAGLSKRKLVWRIGLDKAAFIVWTNQHVWCYEFKKIYIYRAFRNVLWVYKYLLQETRKTRIYETCTDRKRTQKLFQVNFFYRSSHFCR